jgi:hypothetical protein
MTKTPEQNDIHVQINHDVRSIISSVKNLTQSNPGLPFGLF